jgi:tetratricopeptide (TPR) repeat protein
MKDFSAASAELEKLKQIQAGLKENKKDYEANQTAIQIAAAEASIVFAKGKKQEGIARMITATDMEFATEKHSVTPGEVVPTLELLGDMYLQTGDYRNALDTYVANLKIRPGRFNSVYGAAIAAKKSGDNATAKKYFEQLIKLTKSSPKSRPEIKEAENFLSGKNS